MEQVESLHQTVYENLHQYSHTKPVPKNLQNFKTEVLYDHNNLNIGNPEGMKSLCQWHFSSHVRYCTIHNSQGMDIQAMN